MQPTKSLLVPGAIAGGQQRNIEVHHYGGDEFMISIITTATSLKSIIGADSARQIQEFLSGQIAEAKPPKLVTVNWDLYKPSGKWAYGGQATFPQPEGYLETPNLLMLVAHNQNEVGNHCIIDGGYTVVIKETAECMADPEYKGFLCRMVPGQEDE